MGGTSPTVASTGRNIAYRTIALNDDNERTALLNDIELCMAHFCDESNTYYLNKQHIEIKQVPTGELDFDVNDDNPLSGANYA